MQPSARTQRSIIREEIARFFGIPVDTPWKYAVHRLRVCEECGTSFIPKRWFSRFCERSCYGKNYSRMYRKWAKIRGRGRKKPRVHRRAA